jgi:hypothetical protein
VGGRSLLSSIFSSFILRGSRPPTGGLEEAEISSIEEPRPGQPLCYSCRNHRKYPHVENGCSECVREGQKEQSLSPLPRHQLVKAIENHYGVTFWDFWGAAKRGKMCFSKMYDAKHLVSCQHYERNKRLECGHRHPFS